MSNLRRFFLSIGVLLALCCQTARAQFSPGDILLDNLRGSNIQQYSSSGTLKHTFTGSGYLWEGASLTPSGDLVTTFRSTDKAGAGLSGVDVFNPAGTQLISFTTPQISFPGDVSVFPDGNFAVSDQTTPAIQIYSPSGALVRTIVPTGLRDPYGNTTMSKDGTLWVADIGSNELFNLSEAGALLQAVPLTFSPDDLVVATDGTLFVSGDDDEVYHLSATGSVLGSFATPIDELVGIGLAPDGSLWLTGANDSNMYNYSTTGTLLGEFPISSPNDPLFLTVVPGAAPEPSTFALLVVVAVGLLAYGWRRRAARP